MKWQHQLAAQATEEERQAIMETLSKTALTPAERQQKRRDKKKATGLVKVELYVKPDQVSKLRRYAEKL